MRAQNDEEWDDTNHTDFPIATADLVAAQQDYALPSVASASEKFLDLQRVEAKDSSGNWMLLKKMDKKRLGVALDEFQKTDGTPVWYDLEANSMFLYPAPSYASTGGLKLHYIRRQDYFTAADTTQEPGFPAPFHRILSLGAAYDYAVSKGLPNTNHLLEQTNQLIAQLEEFFNRRGQDVPPRITPLINTYR